MGLNHKSQIFMKSSAMPKSKQLDVNKPNHLDVNKTNTTLETHEQC